MLSPFIAKLFPQFQKMLKRDALKVKPVLLREIGSVVDAGGASSHASLRNLVSCLLESMSSADWAVRKPMTEALVVLANVERDFLSEFKAQCLEVFENR